MFTNYKDEFILFIQITVNVASERVSIKLNVKRNDDEIPSGLFSRCILCPTLMCICIEAQYVGAHIIFDLITRVLTIAIYYCYGSSLGMSSKVVVFVV